MTTETHRDGEIVYTVDRNEDGHQTVINAPCTCLGNRHRAHSVTADDCPWEVRRRATEPPEPPIEDVVREGLSLLATFHGWLAQDIWHTPSVRAWERWESDNSERVLRALAATLGID